MNVASLLVKQAELPFVHVAHRVDDGEFSEHVALRIWLGEAGAAFFTALPEQ